MSTRTVQTPRDYAEACDLTGVSVREGQQMLVEAGVLLQPGERLLVKAPTATGKSFGALLIGAFRAPERTIIATYTKLLQDQYSRKGTPDNPSDLDRVRALFPSVRFAVLKGAANYLCRMSAKRYSDYTGDVYDRFGDEDGDPGEVGSRLDLRKARADADRCSKHLPEECGYAAAKQRGHQADVLITNHALVLLNAEQNRVLGEHSLVIIDEVHKFYSAAENYSTAEIDLRNEEMECAKDGDLHGATAARQLAQILAPGDRYGDRMPTVAELRAAAQIPDLDRAVTIYNWVRNAVQYLKGERFSHLAAVGRQFGSRGEARRMIKSTAVDVAPIAARGLATALEDFDRAVLMMSATTGTPVLPTYVAERCGVPDVRLLEVPSALDYPNSMRVSLLQIPKGWTETQAVHQLIKETGGKSLVLCRSWKQVNEIHSHLLRQGLNFPVYVQDQDFSSNNGAVVQQFAASENSVLVGTASFFEGIDVPGASLSQVIVTKLPMLMDYDPLGKERKKRAGASYRDHMLVPSTALVLEQMFGRLIRKTTDRGLAVTLDPMALTGWGHEATMHAVASFQVPVVDRREALGWWKA